MALRALAGKLRGVLGRQAASGGLAQAVLCEHCGKPSSKIAASLGQKSRAIEDDFSEELRRLRWKHYVIRTTAITVSSSLIYLIVSKAVALLEDESFYDRKKYSFYDRKK